ELDRVVITAMGGSLHGAYPAYLRLVNGLSSPVTIVDSSELSQQFAATITNTTLLIVVSQSGKSGEIVDLTIALGSTPGKVISVTNMADNPLANWAEISLCSQAGDEATVSTKSYTGGLASLHLLAEYLCDGSTATATQNLHKAAVACQLFLDSWTPKIESAAKFLGADKPLVFVGRGNSFASANIAALLTQEAAKMHCTALSGGQFRHGPIELVREGFAMIIFLGDASTRDIDEALIEKVTSHGGRVLAICPESNPVQEGHDRLLLTYPDVPASLNPIMEALPIQLLQIPLSIARGFAPGAFLNATKITAVV
ncbi:SIS domain-containing protein, partial [Falsihalocynthiibacter sp. BN13B15]